MSDVAIFEAHRGLLRAIAYRMLGSVAEAEDVVQDVYLKWRARGDVAEAPRAYLATATTRLALDRLRSARARRVDYVGAWLPEPLVGETGDAAELAHDLSIAMLVALERTSPLERAAFLLHDVFDLEFAEIGAMLERSEVAVRQLAARARDHVHAERPARTRANPDDVAAILAAVQRAIATGDLQPLIARLAADCVLVSDGGGKRTAALNPILGRDKVVRFLVGVAGKRDLAATRARATTVNGLPGLVLATGDDVETVAFELDDAGRVARIYLVRNPDKLGHVRA